jgi:hypothetical protein
MIDEGVKGVSARRFILIAPPALLFLAGIVMLVAAPLAWGAAADVGLADWTTTFNGLLAALPAIFVGLFALQETRRRTEYEFTLAPLQIGVGLVFITFVAVGLLVFALRIADPDTYESLRPANPRDRGTSTFGFLMIGLIGTGVTAMVTSWVAFLYCQSIYGEKPSRFDKQAGEEDAIGTLIEERDPSAGVGRAYEGSGFLAEIGNAAQNYWTWMTRGPRWRLFAGVVIPLLVPLVFFGAKALPSITSPPPNTVMEFVSGSFGPSNPASVRVKTSPGYLCSLAITLPSGERVLAPSLNDKTADETGYVSWIWEPNQALGREGMVKFDATCNGNERASFSVNLAR